MSACGAEPVDTPFEASNSAAVTTTPGRALSVHTTLGIPEAATPTDPEHALLVKPQFVVSYDSTRKNPRWTSWELTKAWLGPTGRAESFEPDPTLPAGIRKRKRATTRTPVTTADTSVRARTAPTRRPTTTRPSSSRTRFQQTVESNTGTWETLERYERDLANAGHHLFIVAGSRYESAQAIGAGVAVPTSMFKVIVVLDGDDVAPSDVTTSTRVVSVDIPNTHDVHGPWTGLPRHLRPARERDWPPLPVRRARRDSRRARVEARRAGLTVSA